MKKVILVAVLAMASLASCNKENVNPKGSEVDGVKALDCDCGTIIMSTHLNDWRNEIRVRNNCSDNVKKTQTIDVHLGPGDQICFDEPW